MPRRKKSTVKKPKGSKSGISINIKNILKQVQNERPRGDFINLQKDPRHNLNTGSMTRLQNPAWTFASRPLSEFPSLTSLKPIEFAPPLSQLTSNSIPVTQNSVPIVTPEQDKQNDRLERFIPSVKAVSSNPIIPEYDTRYNDWNEPYVHAVPPPVERYMIPGIIRTIPLDLYDGKEDPIVDESQGIVAATMDQDARDQLERELFSQSVRRGRPRLEAGAVGKKKERLQYGPTIPKRYRQAPNTD
jgi:hypothetical protein